MQNRTQLKINPEEVEGLDDDFIFRLLAIKMVKEIPMKELHKLMKFTKIDPYNFDVHTKLSDKEYFDFKRVQIEMLLQEKVILLEVEVTLPDYDYE